MVNSPGCRGRARAQPEFGQNAADVANGRGFANRELPGDLTIRLTG